ncbi:MAG: hypothetical protein K6T83_00015 [Alicyclobacillus sp.]|nr:hypothetical protein [Alicyclobacillus sp.]
MPPQEAKVAASTAVPLSMNELWSFIQEPEFVTDEEALVRLDLDDCRLLNGYYTLRIMFESAPSKSRFKECLESLGIRFTPKDVKTGRLLNRAETALLKPHIMRRHLTVQKEVLITPGIRVVLQHHDVPLDMLRERMSDELWVEIPDSDDEMIAMTLYTLIFLLHDDDLIQRWLQRAKEVDPDHEILAYVLAYSLDKYFRTRLRASEKTAAKPSANRTQADEIARLREENQRLREQYEQDVRALLDVIDGLRERKRACESVAPERRYLLEGKRVLVVGDESHAAHYRAILEAQGATFDFLPGFDKDRSTASKLAAADGIVFISAYANHVKFYALKATDKCSVLVPQAGLHAFAKGVAELANKLADTESIEPKRKDGS